MKNQQSRKIRFMLMLPFLIVYVLVHFTGSNSPETMNDDQLTVIFTGETLGRLAPCICEGKLAGGLAYRKAWLDTVTQPYLLLDNGQILSGHSEQELLTGTEIIRQMRELGYFAANIGATELAAGAKFIHPFADFFISANVSATDGTAITRSKIATIGEKKIGVTGVTFARLSGKGVSVLPPLQELTRTVEDLGNQCETMIVLVDGDKSDATELAKQFPEVALFIFRGGGESVAPVQAGRSSIASVYGSRYIAKSTIQFMGVVELTAEKEVLTSVRTEVTGETVELTNDLIGKDTAAVTDEVSGVTIFPKELRFPSFTQGGIYRRTVTLTNEGKEEVTIGRVLCPCTCFSLKVAQKTVAPGHSAKIDVELKSLGLKGEVNFPLFVELQRAGQNGVTSLQVKTDSSVHAEGQSLKTGNTDE